VRTLIIVVISLAAYATGAVTARRTLSSRPGSCAHPLELLVICGALAAVAYFRRAHPGPVYFISCAAAMFLAGIAICAASASKEKQVAGGTREYEEIKQATAAGWWKRWINASRAVIDYEFRLLLVAVYLLIVGPIALAFRFLRAAGTAPGPDSAWTAKTDSPTLDTSRRAF
jgi:hypothetical protein